MEDKLFDAIEQLNKEKDEIFHSKSYKLGSQILRYGGNVLHFRFRALIKDLKDKRAKNIIQKKYTEHNENIDVIYGDCSENEKIVIYTCITGGYDFVQQPLVHFSNVDYYLITDRPESYRQYEDIYYIIELPQEVIKLGSILANRYAKFHPYQFFTGYDYAIYLDGNIRVISDIRKFVQKCKCATGIAMHRHRERNCLYQEASVCKLLRRGNPGYIDEQVDKYKAEGFPENFGLNEAAVIVSDLNNNKSIELFESWWQELLNTKSLRDQLSWPFVLWKNGYTIGDVGNLGNDIHHNYKLEVVKHK